MLDYDYIILGAGAAGLLLADTLGKDPHFSNQSILLIDKAPKTQNDRTWCFWEKGNSSLDELVCKSWSQLYIAGKTLNRTTSIAPYTYKMIRGLDFYRHYSERIKTYHNLTWVQDVVTQMKETPESVQVITEQNTYTGRKVFTSLLDKMAMQQQSTYPVLQQHFLGWFVKMEKPVFRTHTATFMDFSIPQKGNTRFMYVLPLSKHEALVEYTLFSEHLLAKSEYEAELAIYLKTRYNEIGYTITTTEQGSIPMTCYPFHHKNTDRLVHIGIAGGWAKPGTGFTFHNTYKKTQALRKYLKQDKPLSRWYKNDRFWWYDLLLLDVLHKANQTGGAFFETLFSRRKASLILKFLGHQTRLWEDCMILSAPKPLPFIKALFKRVFRAVR